MNILIIQGNLLFTHKKRLLQDAKFDSFFIYTMNFNQNEIRKCVNTGFIQPDYKWIKRERINEMNIEFVVRKYKYSILQMAKKNISFKKSIYEKVIVIKRLT